MKLTYKLISVAVATMFAGAAFAQAGSQSKVSAEDLKQNQAGMLNSQQMDLGNAKGGGRHPYVEVPTATYSGNTPGQCGNLAMKVPFDWSRLQTLYGTPKNYTDKVTASLDRLLRERWVTEADANRIKAELISPSPRAGSNNN